MGENLKSCNLEMLFQEHNCKYRKYGESSYCTRRVCSTLLSPSSGGNIGNRTLYHLSPSAQFTVITRPRALILVPYCTGSAEEQTPVQ